MVGDDGSQYAGEQSEGNNLAVEKGEKYIFSLARVPDWKVYLRLLVELVRLLLRELNSFGLVPAVVSLFERVDNGTYVDTLDEFRGH